MVNGVIGFTNQKRKLVNVSIDLKIEKIGNRDMSMTKVKTMAIETGFTTL